MSLSIPSILGQSYEHFELIIVDDGSEDNSNSICKSFAMQDDRITLQSQKNMGVSSARNRGLELARGSFIAFCDQDDCYEPNYLETAVKEIQRQKVNMLVVGYRVTDNSGIRTVSSEFYYPSKKHIRDNIVNIIKSESLEAVWNVLYETSSIHNIHFNDEFRRGHEDILFNLEAINAINSISSIKICLYNHYVWKGHSISSRIHRETVSAMVQVNNRICGVLGECLYGSVAEKEYIDVQGEYLKRVSTCAVKSGYTYREYVAVIKKLKLMKYKNRSNFIYSKNGFVYACIMYGRYKILYIITYIYLSITRQKQRRLS